MESDNQLCILCEKNKANFQLKCDLPTCDKCFEEQKSVLATQQTVFENQIIKMSPEINQITKKLYLGNWHTSKDLQLLKQHKITHILVAGDFLSQYYKNEFEYKQIDIADSLNQSIQEFLIPCCEFIDQADTVYVHCSAGVSRSASIVIAFMIWKYKLPLTEAFEYVKTKRNKISPNSNFIEQLKLFEKDILQQDYQELCNCCFENPINNNNNNSNEIICEKCLQNNNKKEMTYPLYLYTQFSKVESKIVQVEENIFMGNWQVSSDVSLLKSNKISNILIVGDFLLQHFSNQFNYKQVDFSLMQNPQQIKKNIMECIEFLQVALKNNNNVLIHCHNGNRSSIIVIAYLMQKNNISFEKAFQEIQSQLNKTIKISQSFQKELLSLEQKLNES